MSKFAFVLSEIKAVLFVLLTGATCKFSEGVVKMMGRIVDPKEIASKKMKGEIESQEFEHELHDHTFGT